MRGWQRSSAKPAALPVVPQLAEPLYSLTVMDLCDRLRLMFFGNLHQDWSEFVLADLGIYTYEKVAFCAESRGLRSRDDVHGVLFLPQCQHALKLAPRCTTCWRRWPR